MCIRDSFEAGLRALKWLFDALAAAIVLPSVIRAPDAIFFDKSIVEGRPAVGAVLADETVISTLISEQHQILAQDSYLLFWFRVAELGCCCHNMPVAPQQLARRSFRTYACEQVVLFSTEHGDKLLFLDGRLTLSLIHISEPTRLLS